MTATHTLHAAMNIIRKNEHIYVRIAGSVKAYIRVTQVEAIRPLIDRLNHIDGVKLHETENAVYIEGLVE